MRQKSRHVKENSKTFDENILGWDAMIRDAKKRIEDLKFSIEVFERRKAAGEPWPGTQLSNHGANEQHAI
jgi:hypothetical protein